MDRIKKLSLSILILLSSSLFAQVWTPLHKWQDSPIEWEEKFQKWVESEQVHREMFTKEDSPYKDIYTDCADFIYALRIIFSYENSLPFKALVPGTKYSKIKKYYSQSSKRWNHLDETSRVRSFILHVIDNLGTDHLAHNDSYPIKLADIKSGDIFMIKFTPEGKETQTKHSQVIKSISEIGLFDVIYGTRNTVLEKKNLYHVKQRKFSDNLAPFINHQGFKRFKQPWQYEATVTDLPSYSQEQYKRTNEHQGEGFFKYVQALHKKKDETVEQGAKRFFTSLCESFQERAKFVDSALKYLEKINHRCMNYSEYDTHSTPMRDGQIKALISDAQIFKEVRQPNNEENSYSQLINILFSENSGALEKETIQKACLIKVSENYSFDLVEVKDLLLSGLLSSNPNDKIEYRWGIKNSHLKTKCPEF